MVSAELLQSLRGLEDLPRLVEALGFERAWRELPEGSLGAGALPVEIGGQGEFRWIGILQGAGPARRAARLLAARGIPAAVLGLDRHHRSLSLASGSAPPLELRIDAPDALGLARLERTRANASEPALATAFRIAEAVQGLGVDQRFFAGFRRHLECCIQAMPPGIPRVDRHAIGLLLLTRILFLYFIEAKGWLAGRPRFLREEVDRCLAARRSLHRDLLRPLFFGTLNRPGAQRSAVARRSGDLPFLNGGLFEPHPLERSHRVTLPTPVLREAFDGLFERFHFTLAAPSENAIAPDMLGRVFEGVMAPEERHASGSYYTPAALVDALLRDALVSWLAARLKVPWASAADRLAAPDGLTRKALASLRLLDPAVGSGAFLLGALRLLAGPEGRPGPRRSGALRRVLALSLYGVDRNAAAVRLAELRLWLEVVAADPAERPRDVTPLPNLDALVRQGDSLLDPSVGLPFLAPSPAAAAGLRNVRARVVATAGAGKRAALADLRLAELRLARESADRGLATVERAIGELVRSGKSPTLFGERRGLDRGERATLASLRHRQREWRARVRGLRRSREVPWFDYATQFADVLGDGGFDLVVGNPPWVRGESLEPEFRRYLAERFRWCRAPRNCARGYAHPPDLSVAFFERALELTAPDGVTGFLVPAKLATTGYAAAARAALAERSTIEAADLLRDDPRASFDATVYPMALVVRKSPPPNGHRIRGRLGSGATLLPQSELDAGPWVLRGHALQRVRERLSRWAPALGDRYACRLGVKTGLNRVFLDPPETVEPELVRWAVRGRDIFPLRIRHIRRLLWPCDAEGRPLDRVPPGTAKHLAPHLGALRRRRDHVRGKPWALFRTGPAVRPHKVVWADVARRLTAAPVCGDPSESPIPLNSCYLAVVEHQAVAYRLAAWLNSTWSRVLASSVAEPASGGFARFNARVVGALPLPPPVLDSPALLALAQAMCREEGAAQEALDDCCAELLGLSAGDRAALADAAGALAGAGC